jgi:transposase
MIPRLPLRKEAALSRGDLTDAEWRIFDPLLPDRGERGPPISDKRRTVNGILWVLRAGAPWRDMPARYGNWNSVFVRFTRWSKLGVWDAALETLASLGPPADAEHAIDSTIVRAHQHAAGVKGGIKIRRRLGAHAVASRPKSTCAPTPKAGRSSSN